MLNFNEKGYLESNKVITTDLQTIKKVFTFNSKRVDLFSALEQYLEIFSKEISSSFVLWIDGSFVSQKTLPNDIDFLIFLNYQTFEQKEKELIKFKGLALKQTQGLDAYIMPEYPVGHLKYDIFEMDKKYWIFTFTNTKQKGIYKGFCELNFE